MPTHPPTSLPRDNHRPGWATFLRHSFAYLLPNWVVSSAEIAPRFKHLALLGSILAQQNRYGNINPLSIDYACRPRLRSRLTQGGLAWPWNPWSFGGRVSHPSFATHACILTRVASTAGLPRRFAGHTTLPYPSTRLDLKEAEPCVNVTTSVVCLSPVTLSARNHLTSELLRTLLMVAASKPTSWLSMRLHILYHLAHSLGP